MPIFPMPKSRKFLRRSFKLRLKKATIFSIGSILLLVLAGLIILSFSRQGSLLIRLNILLLGYFGWSTVFLPFILIVAGLMLTKLKTPINEPYVFVGAILLFLSSGGLTRAGSLGREIWLDVAALTTSIGAFLILTGGVLIGLVVLFNTSFDQVLLNVASFLSGFKNRFVSLPKIEPKLVKGPAPKNFEESVKEQSRPTTKLKEELPATTIMPAGMNSTQDKVWEYPPLSLLSESGSGKADRGDIKANAQIIEKTLESFGISARVAEVNFGPAVTQYAIEVALGTKLSKMTALSNDLALALAAPTGQIRIVAPIPGKSLVGIELPNHAPEFVTLRKILESDEMKNTKNKLTVALGLDVAGRPVMANIARMPHLLIAGSTGSGKTVCLNAFVTSLLFKATPSEVKLILVDPKRVELVQYNGVPHLLTPVIVDPEKVVSALKWAIAEMDRRYRQFAETGVRNIDAYNELAGFAAMPYIVIIIDELADIILFAPVEVEDTICRLAQMSRATGIHLVISTQRPSVDVLTGLIKANIPARIAFAVSSMVDSRVILDTQGAEKLLGRGDMLFLPPDQPKPVRIQGCYVSEPEIQKLIDFLKKREAPVYTEEVMTMPVGSSGKKGVNGGGGEDRDNLFEDAVKTVCQYDRASASLLQRRLSIGYARAARILDQLEAAGVVGAGEGSKPRDVLVRNPEEINASQAE
ncbi:MAG: DNA translocase FtsK [bacterium]|nr:DNA translocase FtsK [bacterium]